MWNRLAAVGEKPLVHLGKGGLATWFRGICQDLAPEGAIVVRFSRVSPAGRFSV